RGVAGLAAKALQRVGLLGQVAIENFQSDGAAQLLVGRLVHGAHAAGGDVRDHLVLAQTSARIKQLRGHESERSGDTASIPRDSHLYFSHASRIGVGESKRRSS